MKAILLLKTIILGALLFSSLSAEDEEVMSKCEKKYNKCIEKCDAQEDGSEKCYDACDKKNEKCDDEEQDQPPICKTTLESKTLSIR